MKKALSKLTSIVLIVLMVGALFTGCQTNQNTKPEVKEKASFPVTITDSFGIQITIAKKPERIVALAPSIVEILYKLELGDKIVGVSDYSDYPEEAKTKPKVGDFTKGNVEKIVEAKPDLVLLDTTAKEVQEKLKSLNINAVVAEGKTLSQIPDSFILIGKATGTEDKAKALADDMNKRINNVKEKLKNTNKVKVYYSMSFGKDNWTAGKGTFISELINLAGGENIADDVESWANYSIEKIVEKNPDIIILSSMAANGNKDILDNEKGYKDTAAVKNDKVIILDDNIIQRPGPRIVDGLEQIAKALHPEISGK